MLYTSIPKSGYSFDAVNKEITFIAPYDTIELGQISLITNCVTGDIIFQFQKVGKLATGGTITGSVLTLDFDTSGMNNSDELKFDIKFEDGSVSLGLTDAELRASPVPVIAASLPLPTGAALDVTLTDGTQKSIVRGGAKGATAAADVTSTSASADRQPLDVILRDSSGNTVSVGGEMQYTEDNASIGGEQLTLVGAIRQDTLSASQSNDGDYSTLKTNAKGEIYTKDTDVKSDTALLVAALNTLNATINSTRQQQVSVDDVFAVLRRVTQLLERPTYTNQFGEVRIVGGSAALPISLGTLPNLTNLINMGVLGADQSFTYQGQVRQLFNTYINKIIT